MSGYRQKYNSILAETTNRPAQGAPGQRLYYAEYTGDSTYTASKSSASVINVNAQTRIVLFASDTTPCSCQPVCLIATLYWWNPVTAHWAPLSDKQVTIYHSYNGVLYTDTTMKTDGSGTVRFEQHFASSGVRWYCAKFSGDMWYKGSTATVIKINVL